MPVEYNRSTIIVSGKTETGLTYFAAGFGSIIVCGSIGLGSITGWASTTGAAGCSTGFGSTTGCGSTGLGSTTGTLTGSMLPLLLKRLGLDPAVSSAPFVATLVDVTGIVIYFSVASLLLGGILL